MNTFSLFSGTPEQKASMESTHSQVDIPLTILGVPLPCPSDGIVDPTLACSCPLSYSSQLSVGDSPELLN